MEKKSKDNSTSIEETALAIPGAAGGALFRDRPHDMPLPDAVEAWTVLDSLEKMIKVRKEEFRQVFFHNAMKQGEKNEKGGYEIMVEGTKVLQENRKSQIDVDELKRILREKGMAVAECFNEVKVLQVDESKLNYLEETGKFSEDEMAKIRPPSHALKVVPSESLAADLSKMATKLTGYAPRGRKRIS